MTHSRFFAHFAAAAGMITSAPWLSSSRGGLSRFGIPFGAALPQRRAVATTSRTKTEWLIIAPDQDGAFERRVQCRPEHLEKVWPDVESGLLVFGGPYLLETPKSDETPKMAGSIILMIAETRQEVIDRLKKDIYTAEQVWDWKKLQIHPFRTTVRVGT